jgi:predicted nucleic acid-binding protein
VIAVDTSVWIDFFRGRNKPLCDHLAALLDSDQVAVPVPVRVELLGGCRRSELQNLKRLMRALPLLLPTGSTWALMENWLDRTIDTGQHFGVAGLLVAAIAAENNASVWSLDSDFARMSRLGLVRTHEPPG